MEKAYILILIGLIMSLVGCASSNSTKPSSAPQMTENDMKDNEMMLLNFFDPGYATLDKMIEASNLIIRGRVLNERVERVNVNITLEEAITARIEEYEEGLISREERDIRINLHNENATDFAPRYDDVIFYSVEILEIFQGNNDVGDIIELVEFMVWDAIGNPSLEHSNRYEINSELVLFLTSGRGLGYFASHPHQSVYEIPSSLDIEVEGVGTILDYIEEFQLDAHMIDAMRNTNDVIAIPEPFEINLEILREIAAENGLLD